MKYPFYLAENLTPAALAGDYRSFTNLVERNFLVIMNCPDQNATMKWLRVAQLQAHITRSVLRAGGKPHELFTLSQQYLERISRSSVYERGGLKELMMEYSREALNRLPNAFQAESSLSRRFLQKIEQSAFQSLSVKSLAEALHVTPSHLSRTVRQATGRTPVEHIRFFKLDQARRQLNTESVTRAALDSGFGKVSTFIALFRREYGETPGSYKRRLKLNGDGSTVPPHAPDTGANFRMLRTH